MEVFTLFQNFKNCVYLIQERQQFSAETWYSGLRSM